MCRKMFSDDAHVLDIVASQQKMFLHPPPHKLPSTEPKVLIFGITATFCWRCSCIIYYL